MVYLDCKEVVIDQDGVLTDDTVYFTHEGERIKGFNSRDIRAIRELIANGFMVTILTASSWTGLHAFAKRTGAEIKVMRDKALYKPDHKFIAVVNDIPDLGIAREAERSYLPADADPGLHQRLHNATVLNTPGGKGVIAELVTILCQR